MTQCGATGSLKRQAVAEMANTDPGPRPATAMKLRLLIRREHGLQRNPPVPYTSVN